MITFDCQRSNASVLSKAPEFKETRSRPRLFRVPDHCVLCTRYPLSEVLQH
jgi:hypothetical protein